MIEKPLWKAEPKVFRRGVPTDVDVNKLREKYPDAAMQTGKLITYTDLEKDLSISRDKSRFGNILRRWRKLLEEESGLVTKARAGIGIVICDDRSKVELANEKRRFAINNARRSMTISGLVNVRNLTDEERKVHDHNANLMASVIAIAQVKQPLDLPKLA